MSALRERLAQVVAELQQTLAVRLDQAVQQVCTQLDELAGELGKGLTQSLAADLERLRIALADKAGQLESLQDLVRKIDDGQSTYSNEISETEIAPQRPEA